MTDELSLASAAAPAAAPPKALRLWTPTTIGVITFFLGFPGGVTLAAINWIRMGRINKALGVALAGLVGTFAFVVVSLLLPSDAFRLPVLVLNLGFLAYLVNQMKTDIDALKAGDQPISKAHGALALLVALGVLALWLAVLFAGGVIVGIVFTLAGLPIPE